MPESLTQQPTGERYRLIPHRGNESLTMPDATLRQADEAAKELSEIYGCKVLVTTLQDNGIPINHHSVGNNRAQPTKESQTMGTTKMTPSERTSNGTTSETVTDLSQAKSLTDAQRAELQKAREAAKSNGKTTKPKTDKKETTPKVKTPPKVKISDLGAALTSIRKPLKVLSQEQHLIATEIRKLLSQSWKAISSGDSAGYQKTVQEARTLAKKNDLTDVVTAADAALALVKKYDAQS